MKKKAKTAIMCGALVGVLTIGSIAAFFTDADTATNTFTVGKVEIDLQEPDWNPPEDITPEKEFEKNPMVKNTGVNDAYVFVEVIVPYANVITANDDGSRNAAADTELFSYDLKEGWVEIKDSINGVAYPTKNVTDKTITHLYAYATDSDADKTATIAKDDVMKAVAKDETTGSVFDYIKFANVVEDQTLEGTSLNVVVNAYAIQTTNINDGVTNLDGKNDDGKTNATAVWSVISKQNAAGADYTKLNEDGKTDIVR